jgi:energy-coupling factor transporter ATP-binding protein EcfA2
MEPSRIARILQFSITALFAAGVPASAAATNLLNFKEKPLQSIIVIAVYEVILFPVALLSPVVSNVRKRWTARLTESADAWTLRITSRVGRAYHKYVKAANSYIDVKGLSTRSFTLSLDEIFINLRLDPQSLNRLTPNPIERPVLTDITRGDDIWNWMRRAREQNTALVIIGPPGSGKTTLLKHVAYILSTGGKKARRRGAPLKIPVPIALREHSDLFRTGSASLVDLIRTVFTDAELTEPSGWIASQLKKQRFLIMLDGLDEIADDASRRQISSWIDLQQSRYSDTHFLVTSRPFGYRLNPLNQATVVQVESLDEDQVRNFVHRWYQVTSARSHGKDDEAARLDARKGSNELVNTMVQNRHIMDLAINPLLLTMIVNVHYWRGALPGSRSELYNEVCDVFLGARAQARGLSMEISTAQRRMILEYLAFHMMKAALKDIKDDDAIKVLKNPLSRIRTRIGTKDFLRIMEESTGLLLERERHYYAFAHLSFQEYLASTYIIKHPSAFSLSAHVKDGWWHETIRLYAAQSDATKIALACLEEGRTNLSFLKLGMDCIIEGREVGPEAHDLLAQIINPPDARIDPDTRRVAGAASLLSRREVAASCRESVHVWSDAVTNMEYQAFLDDGNQEHTPDHWNAVVYPVGHPFDHVTGVRLADARTFCKWLEKLIADGWSYRLPRAWELGKDRTLSLERIKESGLSSIWADRGAMRAYESHGLKLVVSADDLLYSFDDPWPTETLNISDKALFGRITADINSGLRTATGNSGERIMAPDNGASADSRLLSALRKSIGYLSSAEKVDSLLREIRPHWMDVVGVDTDRVQNDLARTFALLSKDNRLRIGKSIIKAPSPTGSLTFRHSEDRPSATMRESDSIADLMETLKLGHGRDALIEDLTRVSEREDTNSGVHLGFIVEQISEIAFNRRLLTSPVSQYLCYWRLLVRLCLLAAIGELGKTQIMAEQPTQKPRTNLEFRTALSPAPKWRDTGIGKVEVVLLESALRLRVRKFLGLTESSVKRIAKSRPTKGRRSRRSAESLQTRTVPLRSIRISAGSGNLMQERSLPSPRDALLRAYAELAAFESWVDGASTRAQGITVVRERSVIASAVRLREELTGIEWPIPVSNEVSRSEILIGEHRVEARTLRRSDGDIDVSLSLYRTD